MAKQTFQTEVSQLLHLIIHSLYSHKEIFIRELVSNASDAIDKLKLLSLTDSKYADLSTDYKVDIYFSNGDNPSITFSDTGIGMSKKDFAIHLCECFKLDTNYIVGNSLESVNLKAKRPYDMRLNSSKLERDLNINFKNQ